MEQQRTASALVQYVTIHSTAKARSVAAEEKYYRKRVYSVESEGEREGESRSSNRKVDTYIYIYIHIHTLLYNNKVKNTVRCMSNNASNE